MSQFNILFGIFYTEQNEGIIGALCSTLINEMTECGAQVGCVDFAKSRMQIESGLASGKYNVLICKEQLGDERIEAETLRSMEQKFPGVTIILVVSNDRKGGDKLVKLCMNIPSYYNALFDSDLTGENIFSLINTPRTREEAQEYYGIAGRDEEDTVSVKDIGSLSGQKDSGFDFSEMFSNLQKKAEDFKSDDTKILERLEEDTKETYEIVCGPNGTVRTMGRDVLFPDKGKVIRVFDYNTMLLQFDKVPVLPKGKIMEDYCLLFVVKGTQGYYVQGRYKVGLKSFDGYPGRMLGPRTFIVEVPEYNLVANSIEGCECSVVFVELIERN